ncbi:TPA: hypothetical protein HA235_07205 [Candidatus Woesearchaeota archaeon]|nr:hypothetical protein [Candidatus Woesearchaeota archaeon]HIH32464.1 hypothetical protein [Candidatus Woesearchaeota archaeon]
MMADKGYNPDVKTYKREYQFDKEHEDTFNKLMKVYPLKDRRIDNRVHQNAKKVTKGFIKDEELDDIEHMDHFEEKLSRLLHQYDKSVVEYKNKKNKESKNVPDYDRYGYRTKAQKLLEDYRNIMRRNNKNGDEEIMKAVKEGNIEDIIHQLLDLDHSDMQRKKVLIDMKDLLPPDKDPKFYLGLANYWATKQPEDYTAGQLSELAINRDNLVANALVNSHSVVTQNEVTKYKPPRRIAA